MTDGRGKTHGAGRFGDNKRNIYTADGMTCCIFQRQAWFDVAEITSGQRQSSLSGLILRYFVYPGRKRFQGRLTK